MNVWVCLSLAIIFEVLATSALKSSEGLTKLYPTLFVITGYSLAFYFLSLSLKDIPIGIAYAIWCGAGIAMIAIIGHFVFKERLDLAAYIGMALIASGVLVMQLFSKSVG